MNFVQISRSLSDFLSMRVLRHVPDVFRITSQIVDEDKYRATPTVGFWPRGEEKTAAETALAYTPERNEMSVCRVQISANPAPQRPRRPQIGRVPPGLSPTLSRQRQGVGELRYCTRIGI